MAEEKTGRATRNNVRGFGLGQYGRLKHLPALDDPAAASISSCDMAAIINAAISRAAALEGCWEAAKKAG